VPLTLIPLVESPYVQRLRNISQNSRAIAAYPSLNGSRYEHALGTMQLSILAWRSAWTNTWGPSAETAPWKVQNDFREDVEKFAKASLTSHPDLNSDLIASFFGDNGTSKSAVDRHDDWTRQFDRTMEVAIGAVGLLHDIGHPPFSHVLEDCFEEYANELLPPDSQESWRRYRDDIGSHKRIQFHEWAGREIVRAILQDSAISSELPVALIWEIFTTRKGSTWAAAIHDLIDEQIDVDRLDYICRDAKRAGVDYHAIDVQRLITSLELHLTDQNGHNSWEVGVGQGGISAVEALLMQRDQSYRWMIFHHKAILADTALKRAVSHGLAVAKSDGTFPEFDYISKWWIDGPVTRRVGPSFHVDDHSMLMWLREIGSGYARSRSRSQPMAHKEFLNFMSICDGFSSNSVVTWRTYGEFLEAIRESREELAPLMHKLALAYNRDGDLDITQESDRVIGQQVAAVDPSEVLSEDDLEDDARITQLLTYGLQDILRRDVKLETSLEARLNRGSRAALVGGRKGHWLVAHRLKFDAIKKGGSGAAFSLWSGVDREPFRKLSPIYDGLVSSNERRPMLWAFFIPHEGEELPMRSDVQQSFLKTLIEVLDEHDWIRGVE